MDAACRDLGEKLNVDPETLRKWVRQAQVDTVSKPGPSSTELEEIRRLKKENRELRETNEMASSRRLSLAQGARPSPPRIVAFIDQMKADGHAVESACEVLRMQGVRVAAQTYRAWKSRAAPARAFTDASILDVFHRLHQRDRRSRPRPEVLYGRRKMTAWLSRNGFPGVSKHTIDRLMRLAGMNGPVRGRKIRTTIPAKDGKHAGDLLNRNFTTPFPNHSWVTDFTYDATRAEFVNVAFAIDLFSRAIVGWQVSTVKDTALVEACLRMAL